MTSALLQVDGLDAWYDRSHIVQGLSLRVEAGEIVTLMGRNGAGKTTTLRALMGLVARRGGSARFDGREFLAELLRERDGADPARPKSREFQADGANLLRSRMGAI